MNLAEGYGKKAPVMKKPGMKKRPGQHKPAGQPAGGKCNKCGAACPECGESPQQEAAEGEGYQQG